MNGLLPFCYQACISDGTRLLSPRVLLFFSHAVPVFFAADFRGLFPLSTGKRISSADLPVDGLGNTLQAVESGGYSTCKISALSITDHYLGGDSAVLSLFNQVHSLKRIHAFYAIYCDPDAQQILSGISERLLAVIQSESAALALDMGAFRPMSLMS